MNTVAPEQPTFQISPFQSEARLVECASVLQECFGLELNRSFYEDFPVWDPSLKVEGVRRLGAFDQNGNLASMALSRRAMIRLEGAQSGEMPVTLIGGVCTLPEYRGFGLATRLVEELLQGAKENGSVFSVLWGSEHELYGRIGFELFGEQWRIPLATISNDKPASVSVQTGFTEGLFKKRQSQRSGLALSETDIRWMRRHRHVEWYWTGDRANPSAYAAIHRGIDLKDMVHEWGGDPQALSAILKTIYWQNRTSQLLGSPRQMTELLLTIGAGRLIKEEKILIREKLALIAFHDDEIRTKLSESPDRLWFWGLDGA